MKFEESKLHRVAVESEQIEHCISPEHFLEQMHNEQLLEIEDSKQRVCHQIAYTEIIPEMPISDTYVIYVGGFGANAFAYDAQLLELSRRGRKVIYLNPLEGLEGSEGERVYANERGIPEILQNKASEVSRFMQEKGIEQADIVGHSQGGAVATMVTATSPDRINKLILDTPAGLVSGVSVSEFISRAAEEGISEYFYARKKLKKENDKSYLEEWKARLFGDKRSNMSEFLWRMRNEIRFLAKANIAPLLQDIQQGTNGDDVTGDTPEVILVTAHNDHIFKPEEIEEILGENSLVDIQPDGTKTGSINSWVMYADKETGHGFITKNDPKLLVQLTEQQKLDHKGGKAEIIADLLVEQRNRSVAA